MRAASALAFCVVLALYAFPFPHWDVLRSPNELSRLYQVRALVDDGALSVNAQVERYGAMGDLSERAGRLYPNKAPGVSFLGAPVYAALKAIRGGRDAVDNRGLLYFLRLFCCVLPTILVAVPLRRYAARVAGDRAAADAAMLVFLFGSLAFTYSLLFFSHGLSGVLAIGAFLALEAARHRDRPGLQVLGGLLAGYAVVTEYTLAPVALLLAIYGVVTAPTKGRAVLRIAAGALPNVLLLAAYHQVAWGHPLTVGYAHVQNETFASWHAQGYMGVAAPKISSLAGNLFSLGRGLLAFSPAMALGLLGLVHYQRENKAEALLAGAVAAFYFFVAAAFLYEAWGWMLGPRHLVPLAPFLVAPLASLLASLRARAGATPRGAILAGAAGGLVTASIAVTAFATAVYPHVPEEFSAAVAHLVWPLAKGGFLPYNLHRVALGTSSAAGWWAWFAVVGAIALVAGALVARVRAGLLTAAVVLVAFVALQFGAAPRESPRERESRAWIEGHWEPTPANVRPGLFAR